MYRYFLSWKEWRVADRLELLKEAYIQFSINEDKENGIDVSNFFNLSSGQEEIWKFVIDPTYPIKFYKLDCHLGKKALDLHHDFWLWRFND